MTDTLTGSVGNGQVEDDLARARATMFDVETDKNDEQEMQVAVFVYEAPLRLWHWLNAFLIAILCVTGYFIGDVPRTVAGEASDNYLMGYIRFAHFAAGQAMAVAFAGRVIFAFTGNRYARELFFVPVHRREWWDNLWATLKWYGFATKSARRFVGHNALAQAAMFLFFLLPAIWMIGSGLALYAEGLGMDHWLYRWAEILFGWSGGSLQVHALHRLGMWIIIAFIMMHIYVAIREEIMGPQSMISTMISGWRMFKGKA